MRRLYFLAFTLLFGGLFLQGVINSKFSEEKENTSNSEISFSWEIQLADSIGIPQSAIEFALEGYLKLKNKDLIYTDSIITIIDFGRSSIEKRLFILDIKNKRLIKKTLVAHGINSGVYNAENFSNKRYSNMSSLGLYLTKETYDGKHGYSLRIDGMNKGLNDNAIKRAVVIHSANYVSQDFIDKHGRLGRSFGCPALSKSESKEVIDLIKNGTCLFIYHPSLLTKSQLALKTLL